MGKNQFFGPVKWNNFAVIPGQIIATIQLGYRSDEELQKIFDEKKAEKADEVFEKVFVSEFKAIVNLRAVTIKQLMNNNDRWCVDDFYKQGEKFNLLPCVAEAVILSSCEVICNGDYETMHFVMQPKSFSWGTYGILSLCPNDREYKISPVFFSPRFNFDPETVWIFMEIVEK